MVAILRACVPVPASHRRPRAADGPARRAGRWLGAATVALLGLSACGGAPTAAGGSSPSALPGIKEFGLTEAEFTRHVERTQELIAACMTEAGFEYIPVDVQTVEAGQARMRRDPGDTRRGYKVKYGLGVTTRFDNPVRDVGMGPNLDIMNALPPSDREAYQRTLWGEDPDADFVWSLDEEDFSGTGGCTREAVSQVFTPAQLRGSFVNPKDVLVEEDPRIVQANEDWADCMHDAGYEYSEDQDEIIDEFQERLDELAGDEDPQDLTGPRAEALRRLQQEEIEVSLVDLDCQIAHTDDVFREVEIEVFGQPVSG